MLCGPGGLRACLRRLRIVLAVRVPPARAVARTGALVLPSHLLRTGLLRGTAVLCGPGALRPGLLCSPQVLRSGLRLRPGWLPRVPDGAGACALLRVPSLPAPRLLRPGVLRRAGVLCGPRALRSGRMRPGLLCSPQVL